MEFFPALPALSFSQNVGQNAWVNAACNPFAASLGWRPFVPGFIAPIIKRKFVNLLPRGQDPSPHRPQLLFLLDELLLLTNTRRKKTGPDGDFVLSMWMCVPVDLAPLESPLESKKERKLNVLIGLLSEKPY